MTVLSIEGARIKRRISALATTSVDFDIQWSDVICHSASPEKANSDEISLGNVVSVQLSALFKAYGFRQLPSTWGQLINNYIYCKQLSCLVQSAKIIGDLSLIPQSAEAWEPGWGARAAALAKGDLEALCEIHEKEQVFFINGLSPLSN